MTRRNSIARMRFCAGRSLLPVLLCLGAFLAESTLAQSTAAPTVTYRVAVESNTGMDGGIAWQSVFLLNDGRIASFGTGNHVPNQSNAMRIIDPVTTPGSVTSYDMWPWTQNVAPPNLTTGVNLYVSNYDNQPSIYIPSANKVIWAAHGVFDFDAKVWTHGDRPPLTETWDDYLDTSAFPSMVNAYNPIVAWCSALDKGVWFGNSGGGYGADYDGLTTIERSAPGAAKPWKITYTDMGSQGVAGLWYSRNQGVCIGEHIYIGGSKQAGGGIAFYKINLGTKTLVATLTPWTDFGDYFPQMVYDSARQRIVLIGNKVQEYNLTSDTWTDVTPGGWRGYRSPMGVYHPQLNAIFFRGMPTNPNAYVENFEWHKMTFGVTVAPGSPTALSVD